MAQALNEVERRVFGVLLEKSLAQPQYYPMTINAIVAACNQKSNRDPVMTLDEEAVWSTLEVLQAAGLVARLLPGSSSRVERFRHEARDRLEWEKPQRAVMTELLLRGPQTVGELRTRCSRMYPFDNTDAVTAVLDNLQQAETPWVTAMPRTPGRSAIRFAHQLYHPEEWAILSQAPTQAAASPVPPAVPSPAAAPSPAAVPSPTADAGLQALQTEVENLQAEVAELHQEIAQLRQRVDMLAG